ncbi:expressed unknown protein (Partial), partial [Seminavis robusta]
ATEIGEIDSCKTDASAWNADLGRWIITQLIDYSCCGAAAMIGWCLHGSNPSPAVQAGKIGMGLLSWRLLLCMTLSAVLSIALIYVRELIHFWFLGSLVPRSKQNSKQLTKMDIMFVLQTAIVSICTFCIIEYHGLTYTETNKFGNGSNFIWFLVAEVYLPFYTLLVLRDVVFLWPFHQLLHTKYFYHLHKTHHSIGKDAQGMHAFYIDIFDLLIENAGAPALLLAFQYFSGSEVGFHLLVPYLLSFHDGALHSVSPYSAMYFCPILDYVLKPTIHHQLHHAIPHNKDYLLFVPYRHLIPRHRQADIAYFNKVFDTNFYSSEKQQTTQQGSPRCHNERNIVVAPSA